MKLSEIVNVASQVGGPGFDINQFELVHPEPVTTAENNPIFQLKHSSGNADAFAIKKDNAYVASIVGRLANFQNKPALFVARTFTHPPFRNQGLMTALYAALHQKLSLTLVSDNEMSPETRRVWKKIANVIRVSVIDTSTGTILGLLGDIPEDQIFNVNPEAKRADGAKFKNLRLITEGWELSDLDMHTLRLLEQHIIKDHQIYTHPDVIGKYL